MKNLLIICLVGVMMTLVTSCADEEKQPIITFDQATKGAYVRLLNDTPRLLDLANLSTAQYSYDIEFVDIEQGNLVSVYEVFVSFVDNNIDNGDSSQGNELLRSISASEFGTSDRGFKSTAQTVTLSELLSLFGLAAEDIKANDQFVFDGKIILQDGASYGAENSSAAVNGSAFAGHFDYTLKATCVLPDNLFVGDYIMTYEDQGNLAFGLAPLGDDGKTVTLSVTGPTTRSFDFVYLEAGGFGQPATGFDMEWICDQVIAAVPDAGLGCGGTITFGNSATVFPADITDDSVIIIGAEEWADDGGCGVPAQDVIIKLTKI